jgi:hypothetical protein
MRENGLLLGMESKSARTLLGSEWRWALGGRSMRPLSLNLFGDWFLEDRKTGEVWFLDTCVGRLTAVAPSRSELASVLADRKNRQRWLLEGQVRLLRESGARLPRGHCFGWRISPGLGGSFEVENIEVTELALHERVQSRLAFLAKELPPGTAVTPAMIEEALASIDEPIRSRGSDAEKPGVSPYKIAAAIAAVAIVLLRLRGLMAI